MAKSTTPCSKILFLTRPDGITPTNISVECNFLAGNYINLILGAAILTGSCMRPLLFTLCVLLQVVALLAPPETGRRKSFGVLLFLLSLILVGGDWNMTLIFPDILGMVIPIDLYFSEGLKPPTSYCSCCFCCLREPELSFRFVYDSHDCSFNFGLDSFRLWQRLIKVINLSHKSEVTL